MMQALDDGIERGDGTGVIDDVICQRKPLYARSLRVEHALRQFRTDAGALRQPS